MRRPCEGDLIRQPYAKRECALLYSDVFASCHNVVSASFGSLVTYSVFYRRKKKVIAYPRHTHRELRMSVSDAPADSSGAKGKIPK